MKEFVWSVIKSTVKFLLISFVCMLIWFIHDKHKPNADDSMNLLLVIAFGITFIWERIKELKE